ncbi:hypothetical protein AAKU55_004333, partial [Oxalobacteraceae bacterium GrIS 1.11]
NGNTHQAFFVFKMAVPAMVLEVKFHTKRHRAAFSLPALNPPEYKDLTQNFNDLAFLLDLDTNEIESLMKLTIAQEGFEITRTALNLRNELYIDELQKVISEKKLNGKIFTKQELIDILGEKLFHGAIQGADQIYKHVDDSTKEIPLVFANFRSTAKKIFPKDKFIQIESIPETGLPI